MKSNKIKQLSFIKFAIFIAKAFFEGALYFSAVLLGVSMSSNSELIPNNVFYYILFIVIISLLAKEILEYWASNY